MTVLKGKTALITGGSRGIGYGIAEVLVKHQMNVAITSRTLSAAVEASEKLNRSGQGTAIGLAADVRNYDEQQNAVKEVISKWGKLDVLIANAGLGYFVPIQDMTPVQWNETIETNLTGVFYSVKAVLDELIKTKGYIITIASLAGTNFFENGSAYNASKFGLVGFTQAIMLDVRNFGVKVSTIMPGSVATWFNNQNPKPGDEWKIQPEDIGQIVLDLLKMNPRTLPSKIEVRPSLPPKK